MRCSFQHRGQRSRLQDAWANLRRKRPCQTRFGGAFMNVTQALEPQIKTDSNRCYNQIAIVRLKE